MSLSLEEAILIDAIRNPDIQKVRTLLNEGINSNFKDSSGLSPLHHIVRRGGGGVLEQLMELLLEYGADPDVKDNTGSIPLHYSAEGPQDSTARVLLKYRSDFDTQNDSGLTPLHIAAKSGNVACVKLLVQRGADILAKDGSGSIPLHFAAMADEGDKEILRLLSNKTLGENTVGLVAKPIALKPIFPIRINGNNLDEETEPQEHAVEMKYWSETRTEYIIVQCKMRLSLTQRKILKNAGVEPHELVSECTYLCRYRGRGLDEVRRIEWVFYVEIYHQEYKFSPDLKEARKAWKQERTEGMPKDSKIIEVYVVFHNNIDTEDEQLRKLIAEKCRQPLELIEFFAKKIRTSIDEAYLDDIAGIGQVRWIEEVGEERLHNDKARVILGIDDRAGNSIPPVSLYEGKGQFIAIADTGLGHGQHPLNTGPAPHSAFQNTTIYWQPLHGNTADFDGHGTHVCGSAVGDGTTHNGIRVRGTAPQANLVVQSLQSNQDVIKPPGDLNELFKHPYEEYNAKVHSNSWGNSPGWYNSGAHEIDNFSWKKKDILICWSAGNIDESKDEDYGGSIRSLYSRIGTNKDLIGGQALAKNCITVGACQNEREDTDEEYGPYYTGDLRQSKSRWKVTNFSRMGPWRPDNQYVHRKPDVVAPGTLILSARSGSVQPTPDIKYDPEWCYKSGTSQATPLVAGCAAVLFEAVKAEHGRLPTSALIKALIINGAEAFSPNVPSTKSGFGVVNLANSIKNARGEDRAGIWEDELSNYDTRAVVRIRDAGSRGFKGIKVSLVWTDPPGDIIRNRLILRVRHGSDWPRMSSALNNNVLQVTWAREFWETILIEVLAFDDQLDVSPQPFAVAWQFW